MEGNGLVQRERSDKVRREVQIIIAGQGRESVQNTQEVAQGLLVKVLKPLTDKKASAVSEGLERIVSRVGVQEEPPQLIHSSDVNLPGKGRRSAA
jgi:DNA-binding MarR family transcriptional regulator